MKYIVELIAIIIIIYEFILLKFNLLNFKDRLIIYLALFGQIMIYFKYFFDYKIIGMIPHYLFWTVLVLILLFSKNNYLLILGIISLFLTFITRYLLNECLFYSRYENKDKDITLKTTLANVILLILTIFKFIYLNYI